MSEWGGGEEAGSRGRGIAGDGDEGVASDLASEEAVTLMAVPACHAARRSSSGAASQPASPPPPCCFLARARPPCLPVPTLPHALYVWVCAGDDPNFRGRGNRSSGDFFTAAPNIDHSQEFVKQDLQGGWAGWVVLVWVVLVWGL